MSTDLLELHMLLCSIIMQQYTLQCTTHRNSSATLLLPPDQHHISNVAKRRLGGMISEINLKVEPEPTNTSVSARLPSSHIQYTTNKANVRPYTKKTTCTSSKQWAHFVNGITTYLVICQFFSHFAGALFQNGKKILSNFYTLKISTEYYNNKIAEKHAKCNVIT